MSQRESRGASGETELKYTWTESSSGHLEEETISTLATLNDTELVLERKYKKTNFIRAADREESTERYMISVNDLINLIRQYGQRA